MAKVLMLWFVNTVSIIILPPTWFIGAILIFLFKIPVLAVLLLVVLVSLILSLVTGSQMFLGNSEDKDKRDVLTLTDINRIERENNNSEEKTDSDQNEGPTLFEWLTSKEVRDKFKRR